MTTAIKAFEKKGVYHSELVRAGKMLVQLTGEPRDSKFEGKPPFCPFKVQGDESEYLYTVENDVIGDLLARAPKNVWVELLAEGSREGAVLNLTEASGAPVYTPDPAPTPTPMSGPPPMWPDDPTPAPSQSPQRPVTGPLGGDAVARAVESTVRACEALKARGLPIGGEAVQAIYSTHYIHESKR